MYNDYYLQEISSKLTITNTKLSEIIENQENIKQNEAILISGDKEINNNIIHNNETTYIVAILLCLTLLLTFIMRCLK